MNLTELKRAISKMCGSKVLEIRYGERYDVDGVKDGDFVDMRDWPENSDLGDNPELFTGLMKEWAKLPRGMIADLYVYVKDDFWGPTLDTNFTLVMAHGGEILALYDSVTGYGTIYDRFWLEKDGLQSNED